MTDQGSNDLFNALGKCAAALQAACILATGMIRVNVLESSGRTWYGPPLRPDLSYAGVNLNDFPRYLYGGDPITPIQATKMWELAVDELYATGKAATTVQTLAPTLAMSSAFKEPTAPLVQLLAYLAWQGEYLEASRDAIYLQVGGQNIGLDQRTISWRRSRFRLPRGCQVSPTQVLRSPTGRARQSTATATAVYRHLTRTFPDLTPELDVMFATAVAAGPEFQTRLTELFDPVEVEDVQTEPVWTAARRLVKTATVTPHAQLYNLLKDRVTYRQFKATFGRPDMPKRAYTALLRTRHGAEIDKLENDAVQFAVIQRVGNKAETAMKLIRFQQMMGSGA